MNQLQSEIYSSLSQKEWIVQDELLDILSRNFDRKYKPRRLRELIKECRLLYKENCVELLIIKSNRGYKLSSDLKEIEKFTQELIQNGESMAREGRELYQAAKKRNETQQTKNVCVALEEYCKDGIEKMIKDNQFSSLQLMEISKAMSINMPYSKILLFAKKEYHPFIMKLSRECLENGVDITKVKNVLESNSSIEQMIVILKKEMREFEN